MRMYPTHPIPTASLGVMYLSRKSPGKKIEPTGPAASGSYHILMYVYPPIGGEAHVGWQNSHFAILPAIESTVPVYD